MVRVKKALRWETHRRSGHEGMNPKMWGVGIGKGRWRSAGFSSLWMWAPGKKEVLLALGAAEKST